MGRPKRLYPLGRYRLHVRGEIDPTKQYLVRLGDWNEKANKGRGGVRASYGPEANRINSLLLARVDKIDSLLAEYQQKNPNQITAQVISDFLADKPIARDDKGKDFVEFVMERLESDYSRNRIGKSRYENGKSGMNIFQTFLRATKKGTYKQDSIYLGEISVELIDEYIKWRREIKLNSDASELKMIDSAVNARIQDMRIASKISLTDEETEFDDKYLTKEQLTALLDYYRSCTEERRKEFLEMFFFAFHACGLRVVDVMTLQWKHIDFARKELRKIMIKTNKRHVIPLTEPALHILQQWQEKREGCKYVFNLVKESLDLDDAEALYKARNNATKCINQSLAVVGEQIGLPFSLSMHVARHSFAVFALNKGLSMSVVSRLLGHGSTDVTEKVYAKFLPETLSAEVARLKEDFISLEII